MARERFEPNNAAGRKAVEVEFVQQQQIGEGTFATAHSVIVEQGEGEQRRQKRMVVKRYDGRHGEPPEENAEQAVQHYENLRAAGVRVFTTYRLSDDHKSILMTSGHSADWVCIGTNAGTENLSSFPELGRNKLPAISEFPKLVGQIMADTRKATQAGLFIGSDALFMMVNRTDPTKLDYVFGDLDYTGAKDDDPKFLQKNYERIQQVVQRFVVLNVENPRPYLEELKNQYLTAKAA